MRFRVCLFAAPFVMLAMPASAQVIGAKTPGEDGPPPPVLPAPVQDMLEAASDTNNKTKMKTVVDLARDTNPDFADEIDTIWTEFQDRQRRLASREARRQETAIREAGIFELWSGEGQIGAFQSSGNTDAVGITARLELEREGVDWTHKLSASADYRRNSGTHSANNSLPLISRAFRSTTACSLMPLPSMSAIRCRDTLADTHFLVGWDTRCWRPMRSISRFKRGQPCAIRNSPLARVNAVWQACLQWISIGG